MRFLRSRGIDLYCNLAFIAMNITISHCIGGADDVGNERHGVSKKMTRRQEL